jgi:hypothetical protein
VRQCGIRCVCIIYTVSEHDLTRRMEWGAANKAQIGKNKTKTQEDRHGLQTAAHHCTLVKLVHVNDLAAVLHEERAPVHAHGECAGVANTPPTHLFDTDSHTHTDVRGSTHAGRYSKERRPRPFFPVWKTSSLA